MARIIFLIDMQSFYANVEKLYYSNLQHKPTAVAGDPSIRSGVILAACPVAKREGVKTAETIGEAQQKCPGLVIIPPRMELYLKISVQIATALEAYSDKIEPYSVDELFADMTHTYKHTASTPEQAALFINRHLLRAFGVYPRTGIGATKVLAKMACDHFAKKSADGIFTLRQDQLASTLWPLPVNHLFGVGRRMEKHLQQMGIRKAGHLAAYPVEELRHRFGLNGELLWQTAHGIDPSPVSPGTHTRRKAIGHHMTLPRDYSSWEDISVVLRELSEEVGRRARTEGCAGWTVTVGAEGHDNGNSLHFHRQAAQAEPVNDGKAIYRAAAFLFHKHWTHFPVRGLSVSLQQLESNQFVQLDLFSEKEHREDLNKTIDALKDRYGPAAVLQASSLLPGGQALARAEKIGGHYK